MFVGIGHAFVRTFLESQDVSHLVLLYSKIKEHFTTRLGSTLKRFSFFVLITCLW